MSMNYISNVKKNIGSVVFVMVSTIIVVQTCVQKLNVMTEWISLIIQSNTSLSIKIKASLYIPYVESAGLILAAK